MTQHRIPEHDVDTLFVERWSPRAFADDVIGEPELLKLFEAARWAPSAYNSQPWRFIYARKGTSHWSSFVEMLSEFNRSWAQNASALIIVLAKKTYTPPGKTESIQTGTHSFDAGAATAQLLLQASLAGWHSHVMGGYDKAKARALLNVPDDFELEAAIAIGKLGDRSSLSAALQEREVPSPRRPVSAIVSEGGFNFLD